MIAAKRCDQTACVGMAVDSRHRRPGIGEQAQIGGAIGIEPRIDFLQRSAREQGKVVIEIEPRREHRRGTGENNRTVAELRFKAIEGGMQVIEERRILRIDLVRIHGRDGDMIMFALDGPRHGDYSLTVHGRSTLRMP
jgi:hypothetical protein